MNIREIIERLEHLMAGYNYVVHFGADVFEGVTPEQFSESLRKQYPDAKPEQSPLKEVTPVEIFNDIQYGFDYRGDDGSGLKLTVAEEAELRNVQAEYFDFIRSFIASGWKFFHYPGEEGIPGYPVYWDFRFVVFSGQQQILFIYGSASD